MQLLQADIVHDKEIKFSSLEGLQYFGSTTSTVVFQIPRSRNQKGSHGFLQFPPTCRIFMDPHRYRESLITGLESNEVMVENWLSLSNSEVQNILVEAARPRAFELYSK